MAVQSVFRTKERACTGSARPSSRWCTCGRLRVAENTLAIALLTAAVHDINVRLFLVLAAEKRPSRIDSAEDGLLWATLCLALAAQQVHHASLPVSFAATHGRGSLVKKAVRGALGACECGTVAVPASNSNEVDMVRRRVQCAEGAIARDSRGSIARPSAAAVVQAAAVQTWCLGRAQQRNVHPTYLQ